MANTSSTTAQAHGRYIRGSVSKVRRVLIGMQLEQQLGVLDRERGRAVVSEADGGHAGEQSPRNGTPPRRHAAAHLRAEQSTKGDRPCPTILAGEGIGRRPSG